jgi:hypothetical protein
MTKLPRQFLPGSVGADVPLPNITPKNATTGNGPLAGQTVHFDLNLVNFDWVTWHDYEWENWTQVDALLNTAIGFLNIKGLWRPDTNYLPAQSVYDPEDISRLYRCDVAHTSSTDFADDKPLYWTLIDKVTPPVESVFGRFGNVVAQVGDYSAFFYTKAQVDASQAVQDQRISQNETDIGDNAAQIVVNIADIAQNAADIIANAGQIAANMSAIANNAANFGNYYTKAESDAKFPSADGFVAVTGGRMTGNLNFNDFIRAQFGTDDDFYMTHTGANMALQNNTGNILINSDVHQFRSKDGLSNLLIMSAIDPLANFIVQIRAGEGMSAPNGKKIMLGNNGEFEILFDGSNARMTNATGTLSLNTNTLQIRNAGLTKNMMILTDSLLDMHAPITARANMTFNDSIKAIFGTGTDLEIYHDGSNATLRNNTGIFTIRGNDVRIVDAANSSTMALFTAGAGVSLRYNNANRVVTTSAGVTVTGAMSVSSTITGTTVQVQAGGGQTAATVRLGSSSYGFYQATNYIYATVAGLQAAVISPAGVTIPLAKTVMTKEKLDPLLNGTWAKVTRAFETVYTNSKNGPIEISVYASTASANGAFTPSSSTIRLQVSTNGTTWVDVLHGFLERTGSGGSYSRVLSGTITVPAGHRYRLTSGEASKVLYDWVERT